MVETQSKYLPELESIDTVSLPQNRYVFVEGQKNFKGKKKLNQSMLLNNCYFGVIQYQRAPELPLKKHVEVRNLEKNFVFLSSSY